MQKNPWEMDWSQPQTAQPAPPSAPGIIMGRPDPIKQAQEQRAQQDQAMQVDQFAYQRQRNEQLDAQREQDRQDRLAKEARDEADKVTKTTESEKTAAFLTTRLANGLSQLTDVTKTTPGAASPEWDAEIARRVPLIGGDTTANFFTSGPRQQVEAAQLEILDSALTLGTGAAYTKEQLEGYRRSYFPQLGDDDATIQDKQKRLQGVLQAARVKAGGAAPQIDEAMRLAGYAPVAESQRGGDNAQQPQGLPKTGNYDDYVTGAQKWGQPDEIRGNRMTPEQEAGMTALFNAYGDKMTPDILIGYFKNQNWELPRENAEAVVDYWLEKGKLGGITYADEDARARANAEAELKRRQQEQGYAADDEIGGSALAAKGLLYNFTDELAGAGEALAAGVRGENMQDAYVLGRDTERLIQEKGRENYGILPEIAGGLMAPGGLGSSAVRGGNVIRAGVRQGALAGFGEGEGDILSQGASTAIGGALGYVGGKAVQYAAPRVGNALGRMVNRPRASETNALAALEAREAIPVIQAGERQGIPIRQPDARPSVRADFAAAEVSPGGNPLITRAMQSDEMAVQQRLGQIAGDGVVHDQYAAGETLQGVMRRHQQAGRRRNAANYDRARTLAGDARVEPAQTLGLIDSQIADLRRAAPEGTSAEADILESVRRDLSTTGLTVESLQAQRRSLRGRVNVTGVDPDAAQARLMEVLDLAGQELEGGLHQANPRAAEALRRANAEYRDYKQFRNEVARIFEGTRNNPASAEQAASRFFGMMKAGGDSNRAVRVLRQMETSERTDFATTLVERLGQANNGEFTLAALAKNIGDGTTRQGANHRALRELFGDDGYRALMDIQVIARAKADTAGALNRSRTGVVQERNVLKSIGGAILGGSVGDVTGALAGAGATRVLDNRSSIRTARLLLNPDFTRWLRRAPATNNPRVINGYVRRLDRVAARQPALAADIQGFQQALLESATRSPSAVMAEGQQVDDRR